MTFKKWIFIAIFLFGIGIVLGMTVPGSFANLFSEDLAAIAELSAILKPFTVTTAAFIMLKNIIALLVSFIFSPIFLVMPVLALTVNGGLLSFVAGIGVQQESLGYVIGALLPHGIIELPALIIGEAASLNFGATAVMSVISERRRHLLLPNLKENLRYLVIAGIMLVPAAIIETWITPLFLQ
jgi:stage II sporulation protein M